MTKFAFWRYGINSDEVGISERLLWNMKYNDEHGDQQTIRINAVGKDYEVTHETEVVALLSTIQVLNKEGLCFTRVLWLFLIQNFRLLLTEVKKPEYIPVLEKMIAMYKSAIQFHENLENISGIEGKVTLYELTADGLQFEKDFTLKISENISKTEINGKYTCRFQDNDRHMHGRYGNDYTYHVSSDDLTLTEKYVSAVL